MKQEELNKKAAEILKSNIYLTLATTDGKLPWVAPLFYCMDEDFNFYFISQMDSVHTVHVLKQPKVAFAVFDSHINPKARETACRVPALFLYLKATKLLKV